MSDFTGGSVAAADIIADTLTIGPKEVTGITDDGTSGSPENLITGAALQSAVASLLQSIQTDIQNVLTGVDGLVVLTQNLVSYAFSLLAQDPVLGWSTTGWQSSAGQASISYPLNGSFVTLNKISVPPGRYPNTGFFLLTFNVVTISGTLNVLFNGTSIGTITTTGTYNYLVNVTNVTTTTIDLVASNLTAGQSIVLSDAILTGVNPVLYNLIEYLNQQLVVNSQSAYINSAIATALVTANQTAIQDANNAIAAHVAAFNPHNQYALKSSLSESNILPGVVLISPDAFVPFQISGTVKLLSSTVLKTKNLCHFSGSTYCASSGYLTSTTPTATGQNLVNAVSNSNISSAQPTTLFTLNAATLPVLTYTFLKQRILTEIVLFTEVQTGVACVIQASVTAGGVTQNVTITAGANNTIVSGIATFANVLTSSVVITVLSVSDLTQQNISLGFNVIFGDTGVQDISISGETVFTFNYNGQIISLTPVTDIPVTVSSLVVGHEYILSIKTTDGAVLTPEILPIIPTRGDGFLTYKNQFNQLTSDSDPYYGTINMSGVVASSAYHQIYTTENAIVANSNVVILTQAMVVPTEIVNLNIRFPLSLSAGQGYPTSISLTIVQATGSSIPLTITPVYLIDQLSSSYLVEIDLSSYGTLSSFTITLTSANGTTCALSIIDVEIPCLSYDTTQHVWSDGGYRVIVGSFTKSTNGLYQINSTPVDNSAVVVVNDLLTTSFYTQYTVQNPFKTKNVTVTAMTRNGNYTSSVIVETITDDLITVLCTRTGQYLLNVIRYL